MMRLLATLVLLLPSMGLAESRFNEADAQILQNGLIVTADEFILPAYQAQAIAMAGLTEGLTAYCAGEGALDTVHNSFSNSFLAWQRASVIQIGPVAEAEGIMRVQLWPDAKGFSLRAVRSATQTADPALLAPGALAGRSIALVNLTAIEALLYDDLEPKSYACDLATAIADFQQGLAESFVAAWTPGAAFRSEFDTAVTGNQTYATVDDLLRRFLAGAVVYTDRLRKFKILRGLGAEPGMARAARTEALDSGLGLASIEVSFRALRDLYETPYGIFDVVPELGGSMEYFMLGETAGSIADSLSIETRTLEDIATEDGADAAMLRGFADLVLYHETYLKTDLTQSIGMTTGFTAADGD